MNHRRRVGTMPPEGIGNHSDSTTSFVVHVSNVGKGIKNSTDSKKQANKQRKTEKTPSFSQCKYHRIRKTGLRLLYVASMHTSRTAKTPIMAANDVPEKFGGPNTNNRRDSGAIKTIATQGVDDYTSFNGIRRDLYAQKSPQDRQVSSIVLNSSLSDDSSSLTTITIDDSLTTLDGLNIDLSSLPCGFTQRSRSVRFKKVRFRHTYSNDHCHPSIDRPTPSQVRRLGLYEKIALYEQRPDLAPSYYAGGLLSPTPQIPPAAASNSLGIDELVLAPLDEAGELLQIGRTWKASDETIVSVGSNDAVANFNYRDDLPYDEEEDAREQNDCTAHCRVVDTLSLLDVASGSDSRDDDNNDVGNIRDECPGNIIDGDMTRICRICGPRAVSSIIGCVTKEA